MIAIRGATTVERDCENDIKESVAELLNEIKQKNCLKDEDLVCIIFSNTADLHSFYPAKAAREVGFYSCALFSALEPDIDGSLKKCIRVMMLVNSDSIPKHVYLKGAKVLRKDISEKLTIALDGPAGSGKSTISAIIAKKFDILCLDTGAMYRACALKCVNENVPVTDESLVEKLIENIDLKVDYKGGKQVTLLDGKDVSSEIRRPEISMLASSVSALGCVREKMVALQREIASRTSCILDGRDIGTFVLPNAKFKFFLTASAEERARRRSAENKLKGFDIPFEVILEEIKKRDEQDRTRKIAPLMQAADAVLIDSSDKTVEEVVRIIEKIIQEKI